VAKIGAALTLALKIQCVSGEVTKITIWVVCLEYFHCLLSLTQKFNKFSVFKRNALMWYSITLPHQCIIFKNWKFISAHNGMHPRPRSAWHVCIGWNACSVAVMPVHSERLHEDFSRSVCLQWASAIIHLFVVVYSLPTAAQQQRHSGRVGPRAGNFTKIQVNGLLEHFTLQQNCSAPCMWAVLCIHSMAHSLG
jgi:hypothetical protein